MEAIGSTLSADKVSLLGLIHDLRNPLCKILLAATLLEKELEEGNHADVSDYTTLILRSCDEVMTLVNGLMAYEKHNLTHNQPFLQQVFVTDWLRHYTKGYFNLVAYKKQSFYLNLPAEKIPAQIDPILIGRVLDNLVSNASKFTPEGGRILLSMFCRDKVIHLLMADTGIGIPLDQLPFVFNLFTPITKSGTAGEESNGIGLFTAKQIVEAHGGSLNVDSQVGVGSVFRITLPLRNCISANQ